ncbi:hypothetical protein E2C01_068641 [Portunus trituberculatus]|uniref:Uncharacterized protein n=1 Tax=Portunus trituberculatus TaxID=210409 RepID=A0A5B7I0M6_PORTR|nr:hypothetical protein [Portunus trituberculatus]
MSELKCHKVVEGQRSVDSAPVTQAGPPRASVHLAAARQRLLPPHIPTPVILIPTSPTRGPAPRIPVLWSPHRALCSPASASHLK